MTSGTGFWRVGAVLAAILALSGCTESRLAIQTAKVLNRTDVPQVAAGGGVYKVGQPYEVAGVRYEPREDPVYDQTGIASWYGKPFHGERTANGEVYDMYSLTAAHTTLPMPSFVRVTNLENGRSIIVKVNDRGPFVPGRIIDMSFESAQLLGFDQKGTARVRVQAVPAATETLIAAKGAAPRAAPAPQIAAVPTQVVARTELPPVAGIAVAPLPPPVLAARPNANKVNVAPQVSLVKVAQSSIYVQAGAFASYDNAAKLSQELAAYGPVAISPVAAGGRQLYRVRVGPIDNVDRADAALSGLLARGHTEARIVVD